MNTFKIIISLTLLVLPFASSNRGPAGVNFENPEGFDRINLDGENGQNNGGINFGVQGGPRFHASSNGQGGRIDVEGGRGLGGVHAEAGRGHGRVNVEGPAGFGRVNLEGANGQGRINVEGGHGLGRVNLDGGRGQGRINVEGPRGLGRVNVDGGNGQGRVNVQGPAGFGRVNVEGGNGRGRFGIQGPGGLGFGFDSEKGFGFGSGASFGSNGNDDDNEDRQRLAQAGEVVGQFFRGLKHFSTEIRDKLRTQGLSDQEISETIYELTSQLKEARANGASAEELYKRIQYFVKENDLEEIQRKYVSLVKQGARSTGLGDFESKIEGFIRSNGGVGNAISKVESNFNAAGGIDGIVSRITSIAQQGGPAAVVAQIRSVLSQWGLQDAVENLTSLYRAAIRLTPLGNFLQLASISGSLGSFNPLAIAGNFLGGANGAGAFGLGAGIPGLNIAANVANALPGLGGFGFGGQFGGNGGLSAKIGSGFGFGASAGVGGRRSGILGNTLGAGLESIVRTPLEITERALRPFGFVPGIDIARGVVSTTGAVLG